MKRIAVIGAGAMGALYGTLLARAGAEVFIVDGWPEHVAAIQRDGLRLIGLSGDLTTALPAFHWDRLEGVAQRADLAIVLVDANETPRAAEIAARLLTSHGAAFTLQNGIGNLETLAARLGASRVIGGLSYHSGRVVGPGIVEHTHRGKTWIGETDGRRGERIEALAALLQAGELGPEIVDDIVGFVWTKFIHNCAINPVCALLGIRVGEIPTTPGADAMQTEIIREALAVIAAKGIRLADPDIGAAIKAFCRIKFNKPSMLQHIEASRRTEIAALNGALVREGRALGIPTPYNTALTWMIEGLEARRIREATEPPRDYDRLEQAAKGG